MGWLRDLMSSANPPLRSFGELARSALKSPDWPGDLALRERSLSTLLSKLDREEQLAWLTDRPQVQRVLSRVLSATPDALRRPGAGGVGASARDPRLVRWRDLPGARALDLVREALPPGIPDRVLRPDGPPVWWVAPSGSGRSLCGAWLQARGRAEFVEHSRWTDGGRLPDGPVFLELQGRSAADPVARPALCVAAPFEPRTTGFEVVLARPIQETLPSLVEWAAARLPDDTRLVPESAAALLGEHVRNQTVRTFGEALGWLGLVDELGSRETAKQLERVTRRFVERRVGTQLDPAAPHATWLRRSIYALLLGLVERTFTDSELPSSAERSFEQWMALVPPEVERAVDLDWMRLSLARIESPVRPSDLERAAQKLPPGAFRVITALEEAGLLTRTATDRLRLGPAWLLRALTKLALESLTGRSPFEWGEASLRPHAAPQVAEAVLERTLAIGGSALEPVLDLDAEDQPAYAAAVDVAFRAAGIARLLGVEIGSEVIDGLVSEMDRLALALADGVPLPRIDLQPGEDVSSPTLDRKGGVLLTRGCFCLAALTNTEVAPARAPRLGPLDPWERTAPVPGLVHAYDAILESLAGGPRWEAPAFSLIGRLRRVIGNVSDPETPHPLEQPAQILDEVELGVLAWPTVAAHGGSGGWLPSLFKLAAERHVPLETLVPAIWTAWDDAGRPQAADFLAPTAAEHELFYKHVPNRLLERLLVDDRRANVPYRVFESEQWRAFARALEKNPELLRDEAAWRHIPQALAFELLGAALPWDGAPRALRALWERFPEELSRVARAQLESSPISERRAASVLLGAIPSHAATDLLASLRDEPLARIAPGAIEPLRELLHRSIRERAEGWRDAYRMLTELERELRRVASR